MLICLDFDLCGFVVFLVLYWFVVCRFRFWDLVFLVLFTCYFSFGCVVGLFGFIVDFYMLELVYVCYCDFIGWLTLNMLLFDCCLLIAFVGFVCVGLRWRCDVIVWFVLSLFVGLGLWIFL